MRKRLPIGYDNFEQIITDKSYYVDKTLFIKELIDKKAHVNLFTRPRRFGKTLNLSMIKYFFEDIGGGTGSTGSDKDNKHLFDGLAIMEQGEAYTKHMGKYPVVSITLKHLKQGTFEEAIEQFKYDIEGEFDKHEYLLKSEKLPDYKREQCREILYRKAANTTYSKSLRFLSDCLYAHHGQKVIILIDEYDVPLENAYFKGFYDKMIDFIRTLFESALKTNEFLEFAVMTGCLLISKECEAQGIRTTNNNICGSRSENECCVGCIFTGMNNLKIISILEPTYGEYFGFTEPELETMLKYYDIESKTDEARTWYNGYTFGKSKVYNPWSILNYVDWMIADINQYPAPFWGNTSSNDVIRTLIDAAGLNEKEEIEKLILGGSILKPIHEDITYSDILGDADNLWNFLFFTGYLKKENQELRDDQIWAELAIPNTEVKLLYKRNILKWFEDSIKQKAKSKDLEKMYTAVMTGDAKAFQTELAKVLADTIGFMDSAENFYHGFLLGTLSMMKGCLVKSNRESGEGRSDIIIKEIGPDYRAVIIEIKIADEYKGLSGKCDEALAQIDAKDYAHNLVEEGYDDIVKYGVAFFKKRCLIKTK